MGSRDIASPSSRIVSCPRFPLASVLIWIIAFNPQKKNCPLILFFSIIRSSPSLVDQLHTLDLILGPLGPLWSRNFTTLISQRSHKGQFSISIFGSREPLDKIYPQTLASRILLALPREPITLLLKKATHLVESLL